MHYAALKPDLLRVAEDLKAITKVFKQNPDLLTGSCNYEFKITRKYFVDTDGSEIIENATGVWLYILVTLRRMTAWNCH